MDSSVPMTAGQFVQRLVDLVSAGDDQVAIDLSARLWPAFAPQLSDQELELVSSLLEGAESAVELANIGASAATIPAATAEPTSARTADAARSPVD
jgi:hypothetical protein